MSLSTFARAAAAQIGFRETFPNVTPYWAALKPSWQGQPYCAAGLSWVAIKTGEQQILPGGKPVYYVPSIEAHAKKIGRWRTTPAVGDWVIFSFGSAMGIHVGLVEKVNAATIQTVEFNTSSGASGSQNNGNGVYRRVRSRGWGIRGYYRPAYRAASSSAGSAVPSVGVKPKPGKATPTNLAVDGGFGRNTIKALQRLIGVTADGAFGPKSKRAFQKWLGVAQDGVIGKGTVLALQKRVGAARDGAWGPNTTKALQRYLNAR